MGRDFFATLPGDVRTAMGILVSQKGVTVVLFLSILWVTVPLNLLVMSFATGHLPNMRINNNYVTLAVQRVQEVSLGSLPREFFETAMLYWDYPLVWFSFERTLSAAQLQSGEVMDTSLLFSINARYFAGLAPVSVLLSIYLILSRYYVKRMRAGSREGKLISITSAVVPSGSGAVGTALAPMACCGGTAVQTTAYVLGFSITGPAMTLVSYAFGVATAILLIIGIMRIASKINSGCC